LKTFYITIFAILNTFKLDINEEIGPLNLVPIGLKSKGLPLTNTTALSDQ